MIIYEKKTNNDKDFYRIIIITVFFVYDYYGILTIIRDTTKQRSSYIHHISIIQCSHIRNIQRLNSLFQPRNEILIYCYDEIESRSEEQLSIIEKCCM